jgi:hypothetical protein
MQLIILLLALWLPSNGTMNHLDSLNKRVETAGKEDTIFYHESFGGFLVGTVGGDCGPDPGACGGIRVSFQIIDPDQIDINGGGSQ